MQQKYYRIITLIFIYMVHFYELPPLEAQTYGLKFQGQDVTLDKRTELNLSPKGFLDFQDEFEIAFDYKIDLIKPNSLFGYVFRIISKENCNVDLLSTPSPDIRLNLVIGKYNSIIPIKYPDNSINNWIKLKVKFLLSEDKIIVYTPDSFYVQEKVGFKKQDSYKIIFGANDFKQFRTTDVPTMNIKDLKIFEKGKLKYDWPLDEKEGNISLDRVNNHQALVVNAQWLMHSHQAWQLNYQTDIPGRIMVAPDEPNGRIFLVGADGLIIYSVDNNQIQTIAYKNKPSFLTSAHHSIYNSKENKIYCYLADDGSFYSLNIASGEWDKTEPGLTYETKYTHHNRYYNASNNSIYLFGGYGLHTYNNEIQQINLSERNVKHLRTNDSIFHPRYLAGLGVLKDTVYIFGGYGSESGNQLINPQSYYDLFGYSIQDSTLFRKFEIPRAIDDMSVASSMWIDEQSRSFYALIFEKIKFNGYLQLIKGNLDIPEIETVGDRLPFKFLDIMSSAGLFYMPQQKKLYAFTTYLGESNSSMCAIYSISYPPNKLVESTAKTNNLAYFFFALPLILLGGFGGWWVVKRSKSNSRIQDPAQVIEKPVVLEHGLYNSHVDHDSYQFVLFGGFQVFNKDFEDITHKFSPLLKELFLLIWLYTIKNHKGITSEKISEILWFDKSESSSRNNRSVNIAKLRAVLEEIGYCELSKKTGYWKINCEESEIRCDYIDFLNLTSSKTNLTKQKIMKLLEITQKGAFLHDVQYDWLDEFKGSVSDTIINTFVEYAKSCDYKKEPEFIIHLADTIFNFDFINEEAMFMKCKAEYFMGKHSLAKSTYEKFFKEYQAMYNQEYEQSFLKILQLNN